MNETFTIETENGLDIELDAKLRALIIRAVELRDAGNFQASLNVLSQSEDVVESATASRQGRFFNQKALALKDLGEYDRAILEFDRAAYCFDASGERHLQGIVKNNVARVYSLLGDYFHAHESVDAAISLVTDKELLAAFYDQKGKCFADEIERENAVSSTERQAKRQGKLGVRKNSVFFSLRNLQAVIEGSEPKSSPSDTSDQGDAMSLTLDRSRALIHAITSNDDAEHVWEILELLQRASDPVVADQAKRHLFTLTPEFEDEYQRQMRRFLDPVADSQAEN